jgi:translation initiation factor 3 subunit B
MGHNIVLSGLKALNGQLEFFNVDEFEVLAAAEHFMATGEAGAMFGQATSC